MIVSQHITATVTLSGRQRVRIESHGVQAWNTGRDGSHLAVGFAGVLLWFFDRRAVERYASAWTTLVPATLGRNLPAERSLQVELVARHPITLAARAHHLDRIERSRRDEALVITTGHLNWAVVDGDAFYDQIELWERVRTLSEVVLPEAYVPTV